MNNGRFIKILNDTAASYSGIIYADGPHLDTGVPSGDSRNSIELEDDNPYSWLFGLAAALGLSAIGTALLNRYLNDKKMLECLKLMKKHLSIISRDYGTGGGVFNKLFERVFGFQSRYIEERFKSISVDDLTKKFKQLFGLLRTEGMSLITDQINGLPEDPADGDRAKERLAELQKKLRSCIELLPSLAKDFIKETLIKKFPNLTQPITDAIKYAIGKYLDDGKLEEFAYTVVIAIGSAMTTSMAVDLATLIVSGFTESYGVGTTVLVAALAAGLVALSAFLAGGAIVSIATWLSTTATSAVVSAAGAAGVTLNPAAIQRIQQILEDIARRAAPAM